MLRHLWSVMRYVTPSLFSDALCYAICDQWCAMLRHLWSVMCYVTPSLLSAMLRHLWSVMRYVTPSLFSDALCYAICDQWCAMLCYLWSVMRYVTPSLFSDALCYAISDQWCAVTPSLLKGHSGADWPIFFSRSIKSLIYNISPTKFGLSIFTVRGQKFEVSFWRWEIPNSASKSYRRRMLVV